MMHKSSKITCLIVDDELSSQKVLQHFIKQTPLEELMKYINNPNGKPKIKQKCRNEVVRRGYRIEKVAI